MRCRGTSWSRRSGGHRLPLGAVVCRAVAGRPARSARTAPLSSEAREPRKGRRSRRSWRTCSCTTRLTPGWPGTCRAARSSATPTTRSCTARRGGRPKHVLARIAARMQEVGLRLHPDKTRIVYCKDGRRRATHEHTSFTFLGYAFRARGARTKDGRCFTGFLPAISPEALKAKRRRAPRDADPPAHRPVARRPGAMAEPHRRRVDQLLRPVLPVGARIPSCGASTPT